MDAKQVATVLQSLGLPIQCGPNGFVLPGDPTKDELLRLERGSGIAGRGGIWSLREVRSGETIGQSCEKSKELRRVLLEWMAGPKPYGAKYARWHSNRFNTGAIWCLDLKGRGK